MLGDTRKYRRLRQFSFLVPDQKLFHRNDFALSAFSMSSRRMKHFVSERFPRIGPSPLTAIDSGTYSSNVGERSFRTGQGGSYECSVGAIPQPRATIVASTGSCEVHRLSRGPPDARAVRKYRVGDIPSMDCWDADQFFRDIFGLCIDIRFGCGRCRM